jgi:hypothetical protein
LGQKQARGFRQFLLRGVNKLRAEGAARDVALQRAKILGVDRPDVKVSLDSLGVMEK